MMCLKYLSLVLLAGLVYPSPPCLAEEKQSTEKRVVHKTLGAGRWFPNKADDLRGMVEACLSAAKVPPVQGTILAGIAPHAGYIYSGKVAGYTFRAIRDEASKGNAPETVVVLGFGHRAGFSGVALMDGHALETPLGEILLDRDSGASLAGRNARIFYDNNPHRGEHSAENLIPFVQAVLPGAKGVIGLMGDHDPATVQALSGALLELSRKKKILVLASTDLLHDPDHALVAKTDKETLARIGAMDSDALRGAWTPQHQIMCGLTPVLTVMEYARLRGCNRGTVLYYRNSGDDFPEGRGRWVVGYGSVIFTLSQR